MADTTIRGLVMVWGDEPPRVTLPVRCLEDELLPPVSLPSPATSRAVQSTRVKVPARRRCAGCREAFEVEGTGYCAGAACVALRDTIARASRDGGDEE